MNILLVLFLCALLSITKSDCLETDSEEMTTISNIFGRRSLPMFPKYNLKFTIKPHETDKLLTQKIHKTEEPETRRPLMVKMIPKNIKTSVKATEVVTRKPLMKIRSFTVKMRSSKKEKTELQKQENVRKIARISDIDDKPIIKKPIQSKLSSNLDESPFNKRSRNVLSAFKYVPKLTKVGDFSEEYQDRHEFIFLEKFKGLLDKDLLYVSEEDDELTTIGIEPRKLRLKRSSNIIKEENMGTTVSPLKFTGHDSRLTNDLYFKNINH